MVLPVYAPPPNAPIDMWDIFARLDDWSRPGVLLRQLQAHLAVCECGLVTTVRSFELHLCRRPVPHAEEDIKPEVQDKPASAAPEQQIFDWESCKYDFEGSHYD